MGAPITWQNVNGPSLAQASAPLSSASQTFNDAFATLRNTLQDREAVDTANWQNHKNINTSDYLDAITSKYKTPEALQAAQANGELDQLRASYGNQIDADKVRGAADARLSQVMKQAQDKIAYQDVMRNENAAPFVDQLRDSIIKGDKNSEAQARAGLANVGYRNTADQDLFAEQHARTLVERQHADVEFDRSGQRLQSDIQHQRATEAAQNIQAQAAASQAASQNKQVDYMIQSGTADRATAKAAGQAAAIMNSLDTSGNMYGKDGPYTGAKSDELFKFMHDNKIADDNPDKQAHMLDRITQLQKDGIPVTSQNGDRVLGKDGKPLVIKELPMAAIKQAIVSAGNPVNWTLNPFQINKGPADNLEDALKNIVGKAMVDDKGNARVKALEDLRQYQEATTRVTENAAPIRSVGTPIAHGGGKKH